jgi:hypothetical protein
MVRRYGAGALAVAALAVPLTGCLPRIGGIGKSGESTPSPAGSALVAQVFQRASAVTDDLGYVRADISTRNSMPGLTGSLMLTGRIRFQRAPVMAVDLDNVTVRLGSKSATGIEEILIEDTLYFGIFTERGMYWEKFPASSSGEKSGSAIALSRAQLLQEDPALQMKMFGASTDAYEVGPATVAGTPTTHYEGTFAMADALAKIADDRDRAEPRNQQANADRMHFDVWLDSAGLPRRALMSTLAGTRAPMSQEATYSDFDVPVSIERPRGAHVGRPPGKADRRDGFAA